MMKKKCKVVLNWNFQKLVVPAEEYLIYKGCYSFFFFLLLLLFLQSGTATCFKIACSLVDGDVPKLAVRNFCGPHLGLMLGPCLEGLL